MSIPICVSKKDKKYVCYFSSCLSYKDTEDPTIISCPEDQTKHVASDDTSTAVAYWTNPQANDNSGVTPTLTCSKESGSQFPVGKTEVICDARDPSGNEALCNFTIAGNEGY